MKQIAGIGIINSALGGSDTVMIAGGTVTLDWWLMSRPEIKTPAQLKGRRRGDQQLRHGQ